MVVRCAGEKRTGVQFEDNEDEGGWWVRNGLAGEVGEGEDGDHKEEVRRLVKQKKEREMGRPLRQFMEE